MASAISGVPASSTKRIVARAKSSLGRARWSTSGPIVCFSRSAYSGRDHLSDAICADTFVGRMLCRGAPGFVSRKRHTSTLWHIMSVSTPPPCSSPRQNHGMCGPLCSSAARAR